MREFYITEEQEKRIEKWDKCKGIIGDATGGRLSYEFSPCSLGVAVRVKCAQCKEHIDLFEQMD